MRRTSMTGAAIMLLGICMLSPAKADPVASFSAFTGEGNRIEMHFGDDFHLGAETINAAGPLVEVTDDPAVNQGTSGYGGKDATLTQSGTFVCTILDGDDWSLIVNSDASSAMLVSNVPGCAGMIMFSGFGTPGVAVTPSAAVNPGADGAQAQLDVTITRMATALGSFAGHTIDDIHFAFISHTSLVQPGVGIQQPG